MSDTSHCDLAAVLPYAEPVLISPPLIPLWRGHGSTFPLCSGLSSLSAPGGGEGRVRWRIPERGAGTHLTLPSLRDGPLPLPPEGRRGAIVSKICASTKRRPATRGARGRPRAAAAPGGRGRRGGGARRGRRCGGGEGWRGGSKMSII